MTSISPWLVSASMSLCVIAALAITTGLVTFRVKVSGAHGGAVGVPCANVLSTATTNGLFGEGCWRWHAPVAKRSGTSNRNRGVMGAQAPVAGACHSLAASVEHRFGAPPRAGH